MSTYTLTYYYDALCGWCFGISDIMDQVQEHYQEKIDIKVISGGLFVGDRTGLINQVAPHISQGAYKSVEMATGVKFGRKFLEGPLKTGNMRLDSLPPAIALCIVKEIAPNKTLQFSAALNKAFYVKGCLPEDIDTYTACAKECGIPTDQIRAKMTESAYRDLALADFKYASKQQVSCYPTLMLETPEDTFQLTNGQYRYQSLVKTIDSLLVDVKPLDSVKNR